MERVKEKIMGKFIEVHFKTRPILINLDWVEEIHKEESGKARIYFAFKGPDACEQDSIITDESYEKICECVWRKGL